MAYDKKAQAKYREKCISFTIKYTPTDITEGERLKAYLLTQNQSTNEYLKSLVKRDLDSKGV